MIPPDVAARVRLLTQEFLAEHQPSARVEAIHRLTPVTPIGRELPANLQEGAQFRATIQRPLPNGTFVALVAGQEMTLAMDRALKSGDTLELVVARREGNQIWAREIPQQPSTASPSAAATSGQPAVQTQWSPAAALLRQLLRSASPSEPLPVPIAQKIAAPPAAANLATIPLATASPASATPLPSLQPVTTPPAAAAANSVSPATASVPQPPAATALAATSPFAESASPSGQDHTASYRLPPFLALRLALAPVEAQLVNRSTPLTAQQLADTLRTSGLFYEAHLAQWVSGHYPLSELLREPQMAASSAHSSSSNVRTHSGGLLALVQRLFGLTAEPAKGAELPLTSDTPATAVQTPLARAVTEAPLSASHTQNREGSAHTATEAESAPAPGPIPERLLPIVQRQLDALANGRIDLLFTPWSGAVARWIVDDPDEENHARSRPDESDERPWQSRLTVTSEVLGPITFWLSVAPQRISVAIAAAQPETEALLQQQMAELLDHFAADGLPLAQLEWRSFPPQERKNE